MKTNDRKRGIALAKSYLTKFADWDFPEWYYAIATDKNYDTVEQYIRAIKKMDNKTFYKELLEGILYNRKEFRKDWSTDKDTYYKLWAGNIYQEFQF